MFQHIIVNTNRKIEFLIADKDSRQFKLDVRTLRFELEKLHILLNSFLIKPSQITNVSQAQTRIRIGGLCLNRLFIRYNGLIKFFTFFVQYTKVQVKVTTGAIAMGSFPVSSNSLRILACRPVGIAQLFINFYSLFRGILQRCLKISHRIFTFASLCLLLTGFGFTTQTIAVFRLFDIALLIIDSRHQQVDLAILRSNRLGLLELIKGLIPLVLLHQEKSQLNMGLLVIGIVRQNPSILVYRLVWLPGGGVNFG